MEKSDQAPVFPTCTDACSHSRKKPVQILNGVSFVCIVISLLIVVSKITRFLIDFFSKGGSCYTTPRTSPSEEEHQDGKELYSWSA
ncbi:hypothetical protein M011DRAFT_466471 [Sporormia fimetaria CBS 119925]|uniref:Uncharacterized protein n=1 Tax=Sporormia fimetaria CBS 119925 TaxID=1340428 RepID=A0A6A6VHL7_9PLEO|nr:hypothetical protein M011DRAFT_466471 [Sporormia fimetaria CBS 119925]